jgi:hypothetical protein
MGLFAACAALCPASGEDVDPAGPGGPRGEGGGGFQGVAAEQGGDAVAPLGAGTPAAAAVALRAAS